MPFTSECARSPAGPLPDVAADTPTHSRRDFCLALKAARERRGLTIAQIAESTKVCPSHFEALERGDLRLWPKGLYRRTFFRGYVKMIGLPLVDTVEEFLALFPEDIAGTGPQVPARLDAGIDSLRIVLDDSWRGPKPPIGSRLVTAAVDAGIALISAAAVAWLADVDPALTAAIVAITYFTLGSVFLGATPAAWAWRRRSIIAQSWRPRIEAAKVISAPASEPDGEFRMGEERSWTTDAHRIRPRHAPPRMRVRFKWS